MKKLVVILSFLLATVFLVACGDPVDPAQARLDEAADALSTLIGDPSNITAGFSVSTTGKNNTTIVWSSSNDKVVSFGEEKDGKIDAAVTRPEKGEGDAKVTITATITIPSELKEGEVLTKTWTIEITVKESLISLKAITTVKHLLDIKESIYDKAGEVTIANMTVFAVGGDTAFGYDGTGIIQLYGAQSKVEVGKVYTVTGTIDWYFGIWELTNCSVTLQANATAQIPSKDAITSVQDEVNRLETEGAHAYATVEEGNFEPIYASVTGKIHMLPGDTSNYNTFIIDTEASSFTPGTSEKPASGLMFYYNTLDLNSIRQLNGLVVTIDVVIYTYRSNNLAFAIYYVGGAAGIEAVESSLTDADWVNVTANGIPAKIETIKSATVKDFIKEGRGGTQVAWSFKNANDPNNDLVNFETGELTAPSEGQVFVDVIATITKGTETKTVNVQIALGDLEPITIAQFNALKDNEVAKLVNVVVTSSGANGNFRAAFLQDASGAVYSYNNGPDWDKYFVVGNKLTIVGKKASYKVGDVVCHQIVFLSVEITGTKATVTPTALTAVDALEANQSKLSSVTGAITYEGSNYYIAVGTGKIQIRTYGSSTAEHNVQILATLKDAADNGKSLTLTASLTLGSGPVWYLFLFNANQVAAV